MILLSEKSINSKKGNIMIKVRLAVMNDDACENIWEAQCKGLYAVYVDMQLPMSPDTDHKKLDDLFLDMTQEQLESFIYCCDNHKELTIDAKEEAECADDLEDFYAEIYNEFGNELLLHNDSDYSIIRNVETEIMKP